MSGENEASIDPAGYTVERDVMVAMRDGVALATDIWRPASDGRFPALLVRLPYGKSAPDGVPPTFLNLCRVLDAGYAVVWQDCRGTFGSGGEFYAMRDEPRDGADTIAWLCEQGWCSGRIAGYGPSYLCFTQWASASEGPEGLAAVAATFTSTDYYAAPWYSDGGAMSYHAAWWWAHAMAIRRLQRAAATGEGDAGTVATQLGALVAALEDEDAGLAVAPGEQTLLASTCPWWRDWVDHDARDDYWRAMSVAERAGEVRVPALNVGGWFDIYLNDTVKTFARMRREAGTEEARDGQRLIIGPWDHLDQSGVYHDRQFGVAGSFAAADLTSAHLAFFDRWLRDDGAALAGVAPVRIFVMGVDQWRDEADWPLPDTDYVDFHLGGDGPANTARGAGLLSREPPRTGFVDEWVSDPEDPVPTRGGRILRPVARNGVGPVDQRPVESRRDVLCFSTPVLRDAVEVTGHVTLELFISSSALDTDVTGKLVDVHPDGRALYLTDGILRMRFRESLSEPTLLAAGELCSVSLDLSVTSNVFLPGHRIRLEVASSNFPRYDRNDDSGGDPASGGGAGVARNRLHRGPDHPSRLVLPVIERAAAPAAHR